uniref:HMA domain-containing protein n=1 Tax=Kalanchoe fedtschenkoi TaxID=63787 RepID=A0A7N0T1Z8_KALFE
MAVPAPAEEHPIEQLKYQTWVLKVSIHCEGCKRKVKRILLAIEGVYMISIDAKQHKVTVTGNIEPETLIKKLVRTGKHAEMWPMSPAENERKHGSDKPREGGEDDSDSEDSGEHPTTDQQHGVRLMLGDQRPSPAGTMMQMGPPPANPNGGGGKKKKKKKKKKSRSGGANAPGPGRAPAPAQGPGPGPAGSTQMVSAGVQFPDLAGEPPNHAYPPQGHYPYQPSHMPFTAPVYAVNYSAFQAARSYGPHYHLNTIQPYFYAYPDPESYLGPMDSFESINDENPNWCSVM